GFLYQHLPLFNKFRVPVMIVLLFQLAATLGLAWGWSALIGGGGAKDDPRLGRLMKGIAIALGLALVVGLLGQDGLRAGYVAYAHGHRPEMPGPALDAAYRGFIGDLMRVSLLALLAAGAGILALRRRLSAAVATVAVLVLLLIELWPVSGAVMAPVIGPRVPNTLDQGRDDVVEFFEKAGAPGTFRILPAAEYQSNRFAGFAVASVGGYHAAKPKLFQDLVDAGVIETASGMVRSMNPYWMRLLNVRYIVTPQPLEGPEAQPVFKGSQVIYENRLALPRATVLGGYRVAPVARAIVDSVAAGTHDSATLTWLEKDPGLTLGPVAGASAAVVRYDLNDVAIEVVTPGPGLLRLADLWYPDWQATVDGTPTEILRADYLLRAVAVPAGKHRVEFHYRSAAVRNGLLLSLASLAAVLALLAVGVVLGRRTPKVAEA